MTNFTFVFSEIIPPQPSPLRSSSLYTIDPKFGFKESNGFSIEWDSAKRQRLVDGCLS